MGGCPPNLPDSKWASGKGRGLQQHRSDCSHCAVIANTASPFKVKSKNQENGSLEGLTVSGLLGAPSPAACWARTLPPPIQGIRRVPGWGREQNKNQAVSARQQPSPPACVRGAQRGKHTPALARRSTPQPGHGAPAKLTVP